MSFGWRGVRGCARPGGGSEEWTRLKAECDSAITGGLAARSTAATKLRTDIQQSTAVVEEEGNFVYIGTTSYRLVHLCT